MNRGVLSALFAFFLWGILPLYWKLLPEFSPLHILLHRIIWSAIFLLLIVAFQKKLGSLRDVFRQRRQLQLFFLSGALIGGNWLLYIYAVASGQTTEASLGYYLCPLVTVVLAAVFLHERLSSFQWIAFAFATIGVFARIIVEGRFPSIAVVLAVSFALYGLIRKKLAFDTIVGLSIETLLLTPFAFVGFSMMAIEPQSHLAQQIASAIPLLIGTGVVTSLPLLFFGYGVRHAPLSVIGFFQFFGPTIQLLIALYVFHEPVHQHTLVPFCIIWAGVALFIFDSLRRKV